jgi:SAM-dependent methyltransferase
MTLVAPVDALADGFGRAQLSARTSRGESVALPLTRWLGDAAGADLAVVERAREPVLDVGCGPGRMLHALASRGVSGAGIDVAAAAVALARASGLPVLQRSVFDPLPREGRWGTVLLLDGNVGIGGDPELLLRRVAELLAPHGETIVELEPPGVSATVERVRLESGDLRSSWFDWARVGADAVGDLAEAAGLVLVEQFADADCGRRFARLARRWR